MELNKFNRFLKIFIVVLTTILVISIIGLILVNQEEPLEINDCVKKGNICSADEIYKGVEVEIAVNDKTKQRFYVISNDEKEMTLMMNKNIAPKVDWHDNLINIYGPDIALIELSERTKSWDNISLISNFSYDDTGKILFETKCQGEIKEPNYDCSNTKIPARGYYGLKIINGELIQKANVVDNPLEDTLSTNMRARLVTVEEIDNLVVNNELPKWLLSNLNEKEGYWTLTSSIAMKNNYCQGALAIANVNKKPSIESLFVQSEYEEGFEIGIRPVITVNKK
ncbi:MAG: hypothetical protein IJE53_00090 [Bacilli bacterium]|nr:hypothetical protein [Bacilli bacterium]